MLGADCVLWRLVTGTWWPLPSRLAAILWLLVALGAIVCMACCVGALALNGLMQAAQVVTSIFTAWTIFGTIKFARWVVAGRPR